VANVAPLVEEESGADPNQARSLAGNTRYVHKDVELKGNTAAVPRYGERERPNWVVLGIIVVVHAVILPIIATTGVTEFRKLQAQTTVVKLLAADKPPPPTTEERKLDNKPIIDPPHPVITPPIVDLPAPRPVITAVTSPPPPKAVAVPPTPVASPRAPQSISVDDLSSRMVDADPPRYPIESRRKHEQGTVVLLVLVGMDGRVEDISVSQSSGFERLDKAALSAVRHWRWSPTMREGSAVKVRGLVEIPFILTR
jgi:protein TonB